VWKEENDTFLNAALATHITDRIPTEQDRDIVSLFSKERVKELVRYFVLFDANVKKICRYQQYFAIKEIIKTVDRQLGNPEGASLDLITYVTDRAGHDLRYAIDSTKLQRELGWEPSLQFEEGIEKTVQWYLDNQEWMDNITSGEYEKYYDDMYKGR
jgi:hypothetical protein